MKFKAIKKLYLSINHIPCGTHKIEYDSKKFIIKKHDRVNDSHPFKAEDELQKNIDYINKYGSIIDPVLVSACSFSNKYIIRGNIAGYYALKENNIKSIPIKIVA